MTPGAAVPGAATTTDSLVELVRNGVLDSQLGALLALLVEGGVPLVVAVREPTDTASALIDLVSPSDRRASLDRLDAAAVDRVRDVVHAARNGCAIGLMLRADSLEGVVARLTAPPLSLPEDEVRFLGVVVILGSSRVTAAHYLRPPERDRGGHTQRRPPAVLATWDAPTQRFDHFAWGVTPELADRVGRTQAQFEDLHRERAALLEHLCHRREQTALGR